MPKQAQNQNSQRKTYDLEERTGKFGVDVILLAKQIPRSPINDPLITQLVKAGTSIGANYSEADGAESKRDFTHKIGVCKKESKETKHWLKLIATAVPELKEGAKPLWQEAQEFTLIFSTIIRNSHTRKD